MNVKFIGDLLVGSLFSYFSLSGNGDDFVLNNGTPCKFDNVGGDIIT